jgi:hypothetical protein
MDKGFNTVTHGRTRSKKFSLVNNSKPGTKEFRMAAVNLSATRAEMPTVISLKDVIEALELAGDEVSHYLDPDTGEITMVTGEERDLVEEDDEESLEDLPDWQKETLPKVRAVLESDRCLELPDKFDIHEWSIMQEFAQEQKNDAIRRQLLNAIHGGGAFQNFKAAVRRLDIEERWYKFRQDALEKIARDWLEEHKLPYK